MNLILIECSSKILWLHCDNFICIREGKLTEYKKPGVYHVIAGSTFSYCDNGNAINLPFHIEQNDIIDLFKIPFQFRAIGPQMSMVDKNELEMAWPLIYVVFY